MSEESGSITKKHEDPSTTIEVLERENREHRATIVNLKCQIEKEQFFNRIKLEQSVRDSERIRKQRTEIRKWKRRFARMKGATKIQEELLALRTNHTETETRIEKEIDALETERREAGYEFEDREEELEDELALAEKDTDDEHDDDDDEDANF